MISESEYVAIRAFDKTLGAAVDDAQRIINRKNAVIVQLEAEVLHLRAELEKERGGRKLAAYKALRRH